MHPDLISRREAAEILGISTSMVRKLERSGDLHAVHDLAGRVLYHLHQVQAVHAERGAGAGPVQVPVSGRQHDDLAVQDVVHAAVQGLDEADLLVPVDRDRTPPALPTTPPSTSWPPLPPWRVRLHEPVAVAADTTDKPETFATGELDALDAARRRLDQSWHRLQRERVALEHAARDLRRERAERDRQAWRDHRVKEVIDGTAMMMFTAGWPMPVVAWVVEQLAVWLGQLDDGALADDGVVANVVNSVGAMVVSAPQGAWRSATPA